MKRGHTAALQRIPESHLLQPIHGMRKTITGSSWAAMNSRCFNSNYNGYSKYGGSGITVCSYIKSSPLNLVALIGERPNLKHSIDRIRNNGNYSCGSCAECLANAWPMNVRWATKKIQDRNKSTNVVVEIDGISGCVTEWSEISGINRHTIFNRINRGWIGLNLLNKPTDENAYATIEGITKTIRQWAKEIGISPIAMAQRIKNKWSDDQLTLPRQKPKQISHCKK